MKRTAVLAMLCLVLISLSAANPTDSTMVGLTIKDLDILSVKVFESDDDCTIGPETDVINLEHDDTNSDWRANYWLRIQMTTSHRVKISIGTDGPLAYNRADPDADTIDVNISQIYAYWETSRDFFPWSSSGFWISKKDDYTDKDYYEIGTEGILTVNDASMGWGYVQVPDSYLEGKMVANYSTNIVVKATVV